MSKKVEFPVTLATRTLKDHKIEFKSYLYDYEEGGGTHHTSIELQVEEHSVIKTLVLQNDAGKIFIMLEHGDCEVSLKELARQLNVKSVVQCDAKAANLATGYLFGGTSPFGTKKTLDICAEESIFDLERIYINGGKRGYIVEINPNDIKKIFQVKTVHCSINK